MTFAVNGFEIEPDLGNQIAGHLAAPLFAMGDAG
jgi:hypothetical protein